MKKKKDFKKSVLPTLIIFTKKSFSAAKCKTYVIKVSNIEFLLAVIISTQFLTQRVELEIRKNCKFF